MELADLRHQGEVNGHVHVIAVVALRQMNFRRVMVVFLRNLRISSGRNRRVVLQRPHRTTRMCPTCRASSKDQLESFFNWFISGMG